jgi:hypothetical protein
LRIYGNAKRRRDEYEEGGGEGGGGLGSVPSHQLFKKKHISSCIFYIPSLDESREDQQPKMEVWLSMVHFCVVRHLVTVSPKNWLAEHLR